jgi:hypothetical protein
VPTKYDTICSLKVMHQANVKTALESRAALMRALLRTTEADRAEFYRDTVPYYTVARKINEAIKHILEARHDLEHNVAEEDRAELHAHLTNIGKRLDKIFCRLDYKNHYDAEGVCLELAYNLAD